MCEAARQGGTLADVKIREFPPTTLEDVLVTEKARKIQLPNDYRALLTLADGMKLWDNEFFGTRDYPGDTTLAKRAREYLDR